MPSVGMRRSTRIFVPKSVGKDGDLGRVLRSGKRLLSPEFVDEKPEVGIAFYKSNGWRKVVPELEHVVNVTDIDLCPGTPETVVHDSTGVEMVPTSEESTRYMRVYDRKRKRSRRLTGTGCSGTSPGSSPELKRKRLLGSFYVRKRWKNSDSSSSESSGMKVQLFSRGRVSALDVIVEFSLDSSLQFTRFFVSVLKFMRSSRVALSGLVAFLCCEPIGDVFSRRGVHFNPVFSSRATLAKDTVSSGSCRIYGYHAFIPLVWFDFSAAPLFFGRLYSAILFQSLYMPRMLLCLSNELSREDEEVLDCIELSSENHDVSSENDDIEFSLSNVIPLTQSNSATPEEKKDTVVEGNGMRVFTRRTATKNVRRKKRSLRSKRVKHSSALGLRPAVPFKPSGQTKTNGFRKSSWSSVGFNTLGSMEGGFPSLAVSECYQKQTDGSPKNALHDLKEVKSELAELGGNIQCMGNILVIESDRCYREEGATIMLECSTSNVWNLVVKAHGMTRYIHQVEEVIRPGATNRFTHAMIWTVENGWKLEFPDRKDWYIFKELHKECVSKNLEVKCARTIPVPGVREIPNYDDAEQVVFSRPVSYISFYKNEVARALAKKNANYDIDPDDEEWLGKLNSGLVVGDFGHPEQLTADKFEEIIDLLEKYAYRTPSDFSDESKMTSVCSNLGRGEIIAAVYRYWLRKRRQKRAALLRVFECQPPRKAPLVSENILRKKRSFKKQANQNGKGKQQHCFEVMRCGLQRIAAE